MRFFNKNIANFTKSIWMWVLPIILFLFISCIITQAFENNSSLDPSMQQSTMTTPELINQSFDDFIVAYVKPTFNVIYAVLILGFGRLIIAIIVIIFLIRLRPYIFPGPVLIVEKFVNSTGTAVSDDVVEGLRQLTIEKLIKSLNYINSSVENHVGEIDRKDVMPLPIRKLYTFGGPSSEEVTKQTLADLLSSIKEFASSQVKYLVPILNIISPPRGIKISCFLQGPICKKHSGGLTLNVIDISGKQKPVTYTIWEKYDNLGYYPFSCELLEPAAKWMALVISKMIMLDTMPLKYRILNIKYSSKYKSYIYNFFGYMNLSFYFWNWRAYELAVSDFEKSIELYEDWYQPYESLGDTLSLRGQDYLNEVNEELKKAGVKKQKEALIQYEKAYKKADLIENEIDRNMVKTRIEISTILARIISNEVGEVTLAKKQLCTLTTMDFLENEESSRTLYNLACCYSLARDEYGEHEADPVKMAHLCLAYSLIIDRDGSLWKQINADPDLDNVRENLEELLTKLRPIRESYESTKNVDNLKDIMRNLISELNITLPE